MEQKIELDQQDELPSRKLVIQRVYVKDLSFETPNAPQIFLEKWEPDLILDLNITSSLISEDVYEVILSLMVTVKSQNMVAFILDIKQAGVFLIPGIQQQEEAIILEVFCPNILYPYAREAVTNLVMKGGFPQLVLAPINFDSFYLSKHQEQANSKNIN